MGSVILSLNAEITDDKYIRILITKVQKMSIMNLLKVSVPSVPLSSSFKYYSKKCTTIHCCTHQQTIYAYTNRKF